MTVYRDFRFLDEAVDSILNQEFRDFELVIVDDGNMQPARFGALERRDPRVRVVTSPVNIGTAAAANLGIAHTSAEIIARLDADDVAEPTRIGQLVVALADNPELGLVGSSVTLIDEQGQALGVQPMPETDLEIRWTILFHNPFYHSTVAFRRQFFEAAGGYRVHELISQDHYLWFDMLPLCRARNIAQPLTRYRLNPTGLTAINSNRARNRTHAIRAAAWARLGSTYDLYDDKFAREISQFLRGSDIADEHRAEAYQYLLKALHLFVGASQPFLRKEDVEAALKLTNSIVRRILKAPPCSRHERWRIRRLCWPLDRRTVLMITSSQLTRALRYRCQRLTSVLCRRGFPANDKSVKN